MQVPINWALVSDSFFSYLPTGSYMFKVNNRNTRTRCEICLKSLWCLYCKLWIYFTPCSSVFIVNFEHVIAGWDLPNWVLQLEQYFCGVYLLGSKYFSITLKVTFFWFLAEISCSGAHLLKSDSHLPKNNFSFALMIALQKWWEMLFISS